MSNDLHFSATDVVLHYTYKGRPAHEQFSDASVLLTRDWCVIRHGSQELAIYPTRKVDSLGVHGRVEEGPWDFQIEGREEPTEL